MFIKTQKETAKKIINEDQQDLNKRIDELRNGLNEKVNALRKLEGKSDLKGFDLKSLSRNEIEALKDILPKVV
ncbi:p53 and DNA damage-regulated protein 1-like protein [Dinothrombium tinctorium]|uniref:p53 and DNA damage-regulated protein 1-like protein n=1 Tax=Dinothrombium tinctorium TaxID=1965070 RepID=A0A443QVG0_9ACAR|nr:p53 and DNA damage-regulated protein 1-like protein [Dinothrombium tinctorium]